MKAVAAERRRFGYPARARHARTAGLAGEPEEDPQALSRREAAGA
jgi:hypothetical protein